ncbi:MAG: helix-turn-helix transcriptional regulator [Nitrospinae bacterium]|nr:helix-turn-helix transcriptional regulator [Nitrospinota bacterium]
MFAETMRKFRLEKGLTQEQLAALLHKRIVYISAIETGRTKVSIEMATDIEKALGIKDDRLTQAWLKDRRTGRLRELAKIAVFAIFLITATPSISNATPATSDKVYYVKYDMVRLGVHVRVEEKLYSSPFSRPHQLI